VHCCILASRSAFFFDRFAAAVDKKLWLELAEFVADSPRSRSCASTPPHPSLSRTHSPRAPDRLHRTPLTYICLFVKYTSLLEFLDRFAVAVDKKPWLELAKFIADSPRSRSCASTPPHPSLSRAP
jgi:hypothetical protein